MHNKSSYQNLLGFLVFLPVQASIPRPPQGLIQLSLSLSIDSFLKVALELLHTLLYGLYLFHTFYTLYVDALAFASAHFGPAIGTASIFMSNVACTGDEARLIECPRSSSVFCRFFHNEDAGVRCQGMYIEICFVLDDY